MKHLKKFNVAYQASLKSADNWTEEEADYAMRYSYPAAWVDTHAATLCMTEEEFIKLVASIGQEETMKVIAEIVKFNKEVIK